MNKHDDILLSVVIPCYNSEHTIVQCVESLENQIKNENCEVICVDDGSQDKTLEILDELATKYKNMKIVHQKNAGAASARNVGGGTPEVGGSHL